MSTLRERAQEWLDSYEGGKNTRMLTFEDVAAIVAEYLHDVEEDTEAECRARELESQVKKLEIKLDDIERKAIYLKGENEALRFSVRCNGVSGAEV